MGLGWKGGWMRPQKPGSISGNTGTFYHDTGYVATLLHEGLLCFELRHRRLTSQQLVILALHCWNGSLVRSFPGHQTRKGPGNEVAACTHLGLSRACGSSRARPAGFFSASSWVSSSSSASTFPWWHKQYAILLSSIPHTYHSQQCIPYLYTVMHTLPRMLKDIRGKCRFGVGGWRHDIHTRGESMPCEFICQENCPPINTAPLQGRVLLGLFRLFLFRNRNNRIHRISVSNKTDRALFRKQNSWRDQERPARTRNFPAKTLFRPFCYREQNERNSILFIPE